LRERRVDIPALAERFLGHFAKKIGRSVSTIDARSFERLRGYDWPGNVRELENVIERAVILSPGAVLEIDAALGSSESSAGTDASEESSLAAVERHHILEVLRRTGGVVSGPRGAAEILKINASTLRSRMKKLGIPLDRTEREARPRAPTNGSVA
jgi:DNA-binding NtrC family response regulator